MIFNVVFLMKPFRNVPESKKVNIWTKFQSFFCGKNWNFLITVTMTCVIYMDCKSILPNSRSPGRQKNEERRVHKKCHPKSSTTILRLCFLVQLGMEWFNFNIRSPEHHTYYNLKHERECQFANMNSSSPHHLPNHLIFILISAPAWCSLIVPKLVPPNPIWPAEMSDNKKYK